ncbi:extracellular solute-binding protein [Arthrobacter sp. zg-Y820]|uniref:extracellular solute-binding protein n=1 Tax=unclassified Arthrobacter TaxID=235627 RepID=UPI0025421239|nr:MULTISPECIES: extracellular solute-binding protein [unclassified Arthrobacter]MCC9195450.1 extracellular solute-binding protein [Arthrobacter sp. zg-Y820]MDK1278309.1 extracellular solute-binding protein [Arthrobacter sp. zg.Y820]WIB10188.1 extracellular solute-binding protein [Arthrobacter sp. zg-Y820]
MRKKFIGAGLAAALLLTGCGDSSAGSSNEGGSEGATLVVYTNSDSDGKGDWLKEQATAAGFNLEIVGLGGGDLTNRIIAEGGNPVADVVFGLNNMYFEQIKAEDLLEPYTPEWSGDVDEGLGDGETFWPIVQQGIVLAYNTAAVPEADAPEDWTDLWTDEQYKGRYESVSTLAGATQQIIMASILTRYPDESGDLGISDEGWEQVRGYFENGSKAVEGEDLFARMAAGTVDMGQMTISGLPAREAQYGIDAGVMAPEVGVPYAVEQVGIIKGTDTQTEAERFIDWFGSGETQGAFAAEFASLPANQKALEMTDPEVLEAYEAIPPQEMDWLFVRDNISAWVEKIELEYMP